MRRDATKDLQAKERKRVQTLFAHHLAEQEIQVADSWM